MSSAIQPAPARPAAKAGSEWLSIATRADANPLTIVPEGCRPEVVRLWLCNSHLFASSLPLCSTVRVYLDEQEITADDVNTIVARLLQPDARARHRFASDVLADLSRMVAEAVKRNKARQQCERLARERKAFDVKVIAADLFSKPT